jgi:hypothetical protein
MKSPGRQTLVYSGIVLYGLLFLIPFLGQVHLFDWDEINFAESAREMLLSGDYITVQINFEPFWEKPPLFIWFQVISMKIFGVNEFAARFPNAVCGILSLIVLYNTGRKLYNEKFGIYWMLAYAGSVLPFFYFKSGIIDPWFNLFIFLSNIYFLYFLHADSKKRKYLILSGFILGLAILTKGPVALLIFILSFIIYLFFRRFKLNANITDVLLFTLVTAVSGGFWFLLEIINGNAHVIGDFINYQIRLFSTQDAGHGGFFMYHFVVILFGVFPASLIALLSFKDHFDGPGLRKEFFLWSMVLFWTVIVLFSIVNTKIIHYSSLAYFPLSYFAALTIRKYENSEIRIPYWLKTLIGVFAVFYGLLVAFIPLINHFKVYFIESLFEKDPFTAANLSAEVSWSGYEFLIGLGYIIVVIAILHLINKNRKWTLKLLFVATSVFIYLTVVFITPRVEGYTQRAAVEFYKSIKDENAYIATLGFKSYAHLYYGEINPEEGLFTADSKWLLTGEIDRDAYFVFKITRKEQYLTQYPQLIFLYEKNGFVFAKRPKSN